MAGHFSKTPEVNRRDVIHFSEQQGKETVEGLASVREWREAWGDVCVCVCGGDCDVGLT